MSDDNEKNEKNKVGYKNPPRHSRFKKGKSGNPSGRPKKKDSVYDIADLRTLIKKTANGKVRLREGDQILSIPAIEGILLRARNAALSGDFKAQEFYLGLLKTSLWEEQSAARRPPSFSEADYDEFLIKRLNGFDENDD